MRSLAEILKDIRFHPEVDSVRLEYADACEAKDPGYASYIRSELRLADPESGEFRGGSEAVEKRISHPFLEDCYEARLDRGFVDHITIDPYVFLQRGAQLLDRSPIRKVTFTPKPPPPGTIFPLTPQRVPSLVPEIMACPELARVYSISFKDTKYQCWYTDVSDLESVLASDYLEQMLSFTLAEERLPKPIDEGYLASVWERAFERPEFRKMMTVGFPGYPGEYAHSYEDGWDDVLEPLPMPERGKDLERKHGYLPALHVATWWGDTPDRDMTTNSEIVLKVLRGTLPKYPVGTPVTEAMYVLPPAKRRTTNHDW